MRGQSHRLRALERKIQAIRPGSFRRESQRTGDLWGYPFHENPAGVGKPVLDLGGDKLVIFRLYKGCGRPVELFPGVSIDFWDEDGWDDDDPPLLTATTDGDGEIHLGVPEGEEFYAQVSSPSGVVGWRDNLFEIFEYPSGGSVPLIVETDFIIPDPVQNWGCFWDHSETGDEITSVAIGREASIIDIPGITLSYPPPILYYGGTCHNQTSGSINLLTIGHTYAQWQATVVGGSLASVYPRPQAGLDFTNTQWRGTMAYSTWRDDYTFNTSGGGVVKVNMDPTFGIPTSYTILSAGSGIVAPGGIITGIFSSTTFESQKAPVYPMQVRRFNLAGCNVFGGSTAFTLRGHVVDLDPLLVRYYLKHEEEGGPLGGGDIAGRQISHLFPGDVIEVTSA